MAFNDEIMVASGVEYDPEHPSTEKATLENIDKNNLNNAYTTDDSASTTINDTDYIPISDASGNRKKSLWSTIVDKLKSIFLPLTGGTISGDITYKHTSIDASKANNNVSSIQYPTTFNILDTANRIIARSEGKVQSNGNIGAYWYVRNYNTSGEQVAQKGIEMTMAKDGTFTYGISDPANFRSAISAAPSSGSGNYLERVAWWNSSDTSKSCNNIRGSITFAYNSNHGTPCTGTLVAFDCSTNGNYGLQIQGQYNGENLWFRNRNGDNGTYNTWRYVIHNGNIGSQTVSSASTATTAAKLGRGGNTGVPMTFNWSGQSGQPSWLWGGNDGTNMYVYNPSNFAVKRASQLNYATDTTDINSANGNGWYSVAEAANANYDTHKPLAINWYWGIDMRTRGIAYTKINGYEILTTENGVPKTGGTFTGEVKLVPSSAGHALLILGESTSKYGRLRLYSPTTSGMYSNLIAGDGNNATARLPNSNGTLALQSSSRRIKENIRDITEEEAQKLLDIDVVKFDYKDDWGDGKKNHAGFIAEDVQKIIPETVIVHKNYDPNLPVDLEYNFPPEMDYQRFIPYLVKMVQMQQEQINELKEEIKALKEG